MYYDLLQFQYLLISLSRDGEGIPSIKTPPFLKRMFLKELRAMGEMNLV